MGSLSVELMSPALDANRATTNPTPHLYRNDANLCRVVAGRPGNRADLDCDWLPRTVELTGCDCARHGGHTR